MGEMGRRPIRWTDATLDASHFTPIYLQEQSPRAATAGQHIGAISAGHLYREPSDRWVLTNDREPWTTPGPRCTPSGSTAARQHDALYQNCPCQLTFKELICIGVTWNGGTRAERLTFPNLVADPFDDLQTPRQYR